MHGNFCATLRQTYSSSAADTEFRRFAPRNDTAVLCSFVSRIYATRCHAGARSFPKKRRSRVLE
jgi:hypothetical protein